MSVESLGKVQAKVDVEEPSEEMAPLLIASWRYPAGRFVTGGGWIASPAGACAPDSALEGKTAFGFVSKYKKGKTVPSGKNGFQFKMADLTFESLSDDWVIYDNEMDVGEFDDSTTAVGGGSIVIHN